MTVYGESVVGVFCVTSDLVASEIIGYAGFDFVAIDTGHAALRPYGTELESCIRATYATEVETLARVSENSKTMLLKALNFGAKGVIVPHVNAKEDAKRPVATTRHYHQELWSGSGVPSFLDSVLRNLSKNINNRIGTMKLIRCRLPSRDLLGAFQEFTHQPAILRQY